MWKTVGENIGTYRSYPRLVGETGGKDFIVAHLSADAAYVATAILRGSFEYQGARSARQPRAPTCRRAWEDVRERLADEVPRIRVGDVSDFENYMGAVIDSASFTTQAEAIDEARSSGAEIVAGGEVDDS